MPVDVLGIRPARQRYAFFTSGSGGIIDDLIIGQCGDHLALIVNASRKDVDEQHLRDVLSDVCTVDVLEDRALLALQGPAAEAVLARLSPSSASMRFMDIRPVLIAGASCLVSRSGYTGEDGFEISVPARDAKQLARTLLQDATVTLIGLGARDSLRTEAGLCLYGSDIDERTTPVEAALEWALRESPPPRRRTRRQFSWGGCGDGAARTRGVAAPRRAEPRERTPIRAGVLLYADAFAFQSVGAVTSGTFGPSAAGPVAMGYVPSTLSAPNTLLFADVRGNRLPVEVMKLPFIPHRYKRT